MNHETLQALYALDVAEVGEEEAAKRWDFMDAMYSSFQQCIKAPSWGEFIQYRRKPGIPWPKVMRPDTKPEWPADAPEWANYMATDANGRCMVFENKPVIQPTGRFWDTNLGRRDVFTIRNYPGWEPSLIERPKPKDYCGVCGEWLGGPVECCGESHLKPPVTKDEAVAVRAARKPVLKKIDWSKMRNNVDVTWYAHPQTLESQFPSPWIAWNCDEHTRGNPLPDGLMVEGMNIGDKGFTWEIASEELNWEHVRCFRITGIQEGWE